MLIVNKLKRSCIRLTGTTQPVEETTGTTLGTTTPICEEIDAMTLASPVEITIRNNNNELSDTEMNNLRDPNGEPQNLGTSPQLEVELKPNTEVVSLEISGTGFTTAVVQAFDTDGNKLPDVVRNRK